MEIRRAQACGRVQRRRGVWQGRLGVVWGLSRSSKRGRFALQSIKEQVCAVENWGSRWCRLQGREAWLAMRSYRVTPAVVSTQPPGQGHVLPCRACARECAGSDGLTAEWPLSEPRPWTQAHDCTCQASTETLRFILCSPTTPLAASACLMPKLKRLHA